MEMTVQPARKPGSIKQVFCEQIVDSDISRTGEGTVTLTVVAQDIYSPKAQHRYDITLSADEIELLAQS